MNPEPSDPPPLVPADAEADAVAPAQDLADARRAQAGDREAMALLVRRHQAAVARLLWRFARTPADQDDLVQETFLRMVRGLNSWRAEQPFAHWLLRIATNVGRDYFRRHAVRSRWISTVPEGTATGGEGGAVEAIDPALDPAARAAADEVKETLAELPPDDRALLTLFHLEGWALTEIAAQFGWTVAATKLRAWRARRRLRTIIERRS
ncbi:sigma-70 family RNA polymerase sigma factor [Opitutus sp. ER46]|uniref:RNA polymerase sigma factor n=1 Tax=Opitutus sp. ER46 TaxID=2161864 RepID=UPI001304C90E|nr:sigma-70 family RNA polymerase sigma factor [Opitutus sp. ER46]